MRYKRNYAYLEASRALFCDSLVMNYISYFYSRVLAVVGEILKRVLVVCFYFHRQLGCL